MTETQTDNEINELIDMLILKLNNKTRTKRIQAIIEKNNDTTDELINELKRIKQLEKQKLRNTRYYANKKKISLIKSQPENKN